MPNDNPVQPPPLPVAFPPTLEPTTPVSQPIPTSPFGTTSSDVPTPDLNGGGVPPTVSVEDNKPKKYFVSPKGRKFVATLFGLLVLVGGLGAGGYLVQQQQDVRERAAIPEDTCSSQSSGGCANQPVGFNCQTGSTCQITATDDTQTCSCVSSTITSISCKNIRVYDWNWTLLSAADLKLLKPGDRVYLTVTGEPTTENFDKARFSVNDGAWTEVGRDHLHTGTTSQFWSVYTIPSQNSYFKIKGEVHSVTLNTWI